MTCSKLETEHLSLFLSPFALRRLILGSYGISILQATQPNVIGDVSPRKADADYGVVTTTIRLRFDGHSTALRRKINMVTVA